MVRTDGHFALGQSVAQDFTDACTYHMAPQPSLQLARHTLAYVGIKRAHR